jgi:DNA-binding transcriptional LysR family regulator
MDFRQLRYFVAVAEALSFSEAARRLHVSQPPLSIQIKALEDELGSPLLERSRHHVALTPAGELFLDKARAALANLDEARDVVRQVASGEAARYAWDSRRRCRCRMSFRAPCTPSARHIAMPGLNWSTCPPASNCSNSKVAKSTLDSCVLAAVPATGAY